MPAIESAVRAAATSLIALAVAACAGDRVGGFALPGSSPEPAAQPAQPTAPPTDMAGRWLLSSPERGQCHMTFAATGAGATEGAIRPEGGCPGRFYMSRSWTFEGGRLVMRDHNKKPLAQLSASAAGFEGTATSGEPVSLMH
jgi:hypothetical protein